MVDQSVGYQPLVDDKGVYYQLAGLMRISYGVVDEVCRLPAGRG